MKTESVRPQPMPGGATQGRPPPLAPPFLERARQAPVTYAICAINVAVFLFIETHGGSTNVPNLVRFGALERSHVWAGEYYRFITPMFIHIGWVHLGWNTYCLVGWCSPVERVLGRWRFALTYLVTGMGACAVSLLAHDAPGSAGASGAAFGIVAMTMALRWRVLGSWNAFQADPWVRRTAGMLVIWTIVGFTALRMDNFAHGGGFVTGVALAAALIGGGSLSKTQRALALGVFLAAFALLLGAAAHRWPGESSVWETLVER
jgi:rhomboid protease GluP